ncbi:MAG: VWA domain-containing protein, partial [Verrucomicrobiota bacterium]
MKFGNVNAFWALLLVPALGALWMAAGHRARNLVQQLVAARLRPLLVDTPASRLPRLVLMLAGLALSVAALARPQWGEVTSESKGRGRDVLILVDVSKSMLANDLPPSRLQRAKLAAEDLVRQLGGDRIGVIAFA